MSDSRPRRKPAGPVIQVRDVCVRYGHTTVLDHVSLDVPRGDFVGVVGPNGGGKSTLLKAMLGLVPRTCGDVLLFGEPVEEARDLRRIAYVPQHVVHVDPRFPATAMEVVLLGRVGRRGVLSRLSEEDREAARRAMRDVGVERLAERRIGTLSGGERQRVFLAKALAAEPEVLILDEPTTGVDPAARQEFYDLLDRLNHDRGITLLLVSHDAQALALTAHRLVAVNRAVTFDGDPKAFETSGGFAAAYGLHLHHEDHP